MKGRMGESCLWEPCMYMNLHIVMAWCASVCHSLVSDDLALFHIVMCVLLCLVFAFPLLLQVPFQITPSLLSWHGI